METALVSALVTAVAMAVYAVLQYLMTPGHTVVGLILEHSWHVLALGGLTYVILFAVLHRQVIRPVNALFLKCYAITKGDHTPVQLSSRIREIRAIADGLNMMLARIDQAAPPVSPEQMTTWAENLREIAAVPGNELTPANEEALLNTAASIERVVTDGTDTHTPTTEEVACSSRDRKEVML
jgi:hypothetical protein